jgi:glycosyltransferase involved in cell wall biosynthesis
MRPTNRAKLSRSRVSKIRPQRMKILLISGARIVGGAERATLQLAQAMLDRGHHVEAACPGGSTWSALLNGAGIRVHRAAIGGALNVIAPFAIAAAMARIRPDILVVTTSDEWVWSSLIPRRSAGPRLVLIRHMGLPLAFRVRWLVGRRADAIVAVSASVRSSLLTDAAIAPSRVHVIHNAVRFPPRQSIPDSAERIRARVALGLPAAGRWIGFLGGVNLGKGVEDVIAGAARAQKKLGDVSLLICGRKDDRRETPPYIELARRYAMEGRVHFLGELDDAIPAIIASDVVAIATRSTLREGLSQSAIDAMACGTPIAAYAAVPAVIASDVVAVATRSALREGVSQSAIDATASERPIAACALDRVNDTVGADAPVAALARPDDVEDLSAAILRLLENPQLANTFAQRGLEFSRREFDPKLMADRYEELFRSLLAHHRKAGRFIL